MPASSVEELLQQLIRIPSVNPEGDPGVQVTGEGECARFLDEFLRELGADSEIQPVLDDRPNVFARFPSEGIRDKPKVLLAPHTDTVSVAGMTIDPFSGELRDGRIHGRGASDTKGPMAAMLFALRQRRDRIPSLPVEIWFAGLMGEEAGQHGARALAESVRPDFVIVGEPTGLGVVHAHKGSIWLTLETSGRAAHASIPEHGENAIERMLDPLVALRDEIGPAMAAVRHPLLGSPTWNTGILRGGTKTNIVPEHCVARIDIRTVPGMGDLGVEGIRNRLQAACPGLKVSARVSAPLETDPANPFIQVMRRAGAPLATAPWFCDAAVFGAAGVPAVAIGPGSISQAHTADEFIEAGALRDGVEYFIRLLDSFPDSLQPDPQS